MSSDKPKRRSLLDENSALSESQLLPPRPNPSAQPKSPTTPTLRPPNPDNYSDSSSTPSPPSEDDQHHPSLPLSMSQSLLFTSPHSTLPTDARTALSVLATTLDPPTLKVAIRFHAIGSAPQLKQKVFKISASSKFASVVGFLRKRLYGKGPVEGGSWDGRSRVGGFGGGDAGQGLFCYVNSVFAPGLDEGVGNLWRCFKTDDQLIVGYSITPAFG